MALGHQQSVYGLRVGTGRLRDSCQDIEQIASAHPKEFETILTSKQQCTVGMQTMVEILAVNHDNSCQTTYCCGSVTVYCCLELHFANDLYRTKPLSLKLRAVPC